MPKFQIEDLVQARDRDSGELIHGTVVRVFRRGEIPFEQVIYGEYVGDEPMDNTGQFYDVELDDGLAVFGEADLSRPVRMTYERLMSYLAEEGVVNLYPAWRNALKHALSDLGLYPDTELGGGPHRAVWDPRGL